uniref:50S ribosomal protein L9 n=1 Tax=Phaeostrophion irregulare TaxID=243268 RepID=UPI002E7A41D5|nr:50S ribosomal protein L9 [Phaeostrophion irregulare]WAM64384.1 50S ribosomal protein L9 [Phaeostrophion irregulare]
MRKKTIQIILAKDVNQLGKEGKLVKVKPGYVRNYLIPLKLGKIATPSLIKQFTLHQNKLVVQQREVLESHLKLKESLEALEKLKIKKKISESGKFFGKITKAQIVELIKEKINAPVNLTKNQIQLPEMKRLGDYIIIIALAPNVTAEIRIKILPE